MFDFAFKKRYLETTKVEGKYLRSESDIIPISYMRSWRSNTYSRLLKFTLNDF
jgi:hypothetical protein